MSATDNTGRQARIERLRLARRRDSAVKRKLALNAVVSLKNEGLRVSFAAVARRAQVSPWFTYNNSEVSAAIHTAMSEQQEHGVEANRTPPLNRATSASLHAELAFLRTELAKAKTSRDDFRRRLQLALGAAIEADDVQGLRTLVQELKQRDEQLSAEALAGRRREGELTRKLATAEDELAAARSALRRAIRPVPNQL
jgi:hypothetical protein